MRPSPDDMNHYITWVLYAVYGRMAQADGILQQFSGKIERVAQFLRRHRPPHLGKVYRGLLLTSEEAAEGIINQDPNLTFVSFTEDHDVACWFADPKSFLAGAVVEQRPGVKGWIVEYEPTLNDVLFHYSWGLRFPLGGRDISLSLAALQHPEIDEAQFTWALTTQREVIVKPLREGLALRAVENAGCPDGLDKRLLPPQFCTADDDDEGCEGMEGEDENPRWGNGKREFVCDICGEAFFTEGARDRHVEKHSKGPRWGSGKREFVCDICGAAFFTPHALEEHTRAWSKPGMAKIHRPAAFRRHMREVDKKWQEKQDRERQEERDREEKKRSRSPIGLYQLTAMEPRDDDDDNENPHGVHVLGLPDKYQRMYEHILDSYLGRGHTEARAKALAVATTRARYNADLKRGQGGF